MPLEVPLDVPFQTGQKIVFIGDSITDAGRTGGEGEYGAGYVARARELLLARFPELHLRVVNRGVGGDTVRHLARRWQADALGEHPDWLSVKIGVNDVWRAFGGNPDEAVPEGEYAATLRELLGQAAAGGSRLVLVAPFLVELNRADPMRMAVESRAGIVAALARDLNVPLVRLQPAFDAASAASAPELWSQDRVHPTDLGHALIALEWLRALGVGL